MLAGHPDTVAAPVSACQNGTTFEQEMTRCRDTIQSVESLYSNTECSLIWDHQKRIGDANHNAEILAHIIPARTHALGQVRAEVIRGRLSSVELQYGTSNQGHSAQFYSTFSERQGYWRVLLRDSLGLKDEEDVGPEERFKYSGCYRVFKENVQ